MPFRFGRKHTQLHAPAKSGDVQALEQILSAAPNEHERMLLLESPDHHGKTALLRACKYGHRGTVVALLRSGANLRAIDNFKRNCLHMAVANGHVEVTLALLRRGAAPLLEQVNSAGKRPLDINPTCNQADIQNLLHQSTTLWTRHRNDTCDLSTTADNDVLRRANEQQRRRTVSSEGRPGMERKRSGGSGAPRMTPAAPARPRGGSGYFVPQAAPLLPCVPFIKDDMSSAASTTSSRRGSSRSHLRSVSTSHSNLPPLSYYNTTGASPSPVSPSIYSTTPHSLLTSMPCYLVPATAAAAAAQGSSAGESGSDTNSDWEPATVDSRSSVSPVNSRSGSMAAVWEVPGKEQHSHTYRSSSRAFRTTSMPARALTTADILATTRDGWALMAQHQDDMHMAPYMLVQMAPASMGSLPSKLGSPRHARRSSLDEPSTLRSAPSETIRPATAAGVAGA